jgi:SAM-dependent methyltransferase
MDQIYGDGSLRDILNYLAEEMLGSFMGRAPLSKEAQAEANHKRAMGEVAYIARRLESRRLLDLGCGTDRSTCVLKSELVPEMEVVGADKDPEAIRSSVDSCGCGTRYVEFDILEPHDIGRFGMVYCAGLMHHIPDIGAAFGNIYQLLEDPGALYFMDIVRRDVPESEMDSCERNAHTEEAVFSALKEAGFVQPVHMSIEGEDIRGLAVTAFRDTQDMVCPEVGPDGAYMLFLRKGGSGLFLP